MLYDFRGRVSFDYILMDDGTPIIPGTLMTFDGEPLFEFIDHSVPDYQFTSNLTDSKALVNTQRSYNIVLDCVNNADRGNTLSAIINLPAGFELLKASTNEGTYNAITGVWTFKLVNQSATLNLLVNITSTGSKTQTITLAGYGTTLSSTCTVSDTDSEGSIASRDVVVTSYPETLANLQDGKLYTVVSYTKVTEPSVSGIHAGIKNNRLMVVNGNTVYGSRATAQGVIQKQFCTFIYDSENPVTIYLNDQYQSVSTNTTDRWGGLCINEGFNTTYYPSLNLLSNPAGLFDDTSSSAIDLPAAATSAEYVYKLGNVEAPSSLNAFFTGIIIELNSFVVSSGVQLWFESGTKKSKVKTVYASQTGEISVGNIAGMNEEWGVNNADLIGNPLEIHLIISNPILTPQSYLFSNLSLILYWLDDSTNGARAFTIEGEHARAYKIFMKKPNNSMSAKPSLTTLNVPKTDGTLVTGMDMDSGDLNLEFVIEGDTIEDAYRIYRHVVRWMTNERGPSKKPVFKNLVFDAIPDLNYPYVLNDQITITEDITALECKAKLTVPGGVGVSINPAITGPIGENPGNIEVFPTLVIIANGADQIVITENVSGDIITLDSTVSENTILYFDCAAMTVTDSAGTDYTLELALNSIFPLAIDESYNFSVVGGEIQQVIYYPGY